MVFGLGNPGEKYARTRHNVGEEAVRLLAEHIGLEKSDASDSGARLLFNQKPNINPARLIELIQTSPKLYKLTGSDTLHITRELPPDATRISEITDLLQNLGEQKVA